MAAPDHCRAPSLLLTAVCVLSTPLPAPTAQGERPRLEDVLSAVGAYVRQYEQAFSAVVSRERYVQRTLWAGGETTRELQSEVALVAVGGSDWLVFRDVYEVDGRAVRDRDDRLAALFMKPTSDLGAQARRIAQEGARYNVGDITRTGLNTPTQALEFLRRENQHRSSFRLGGRRTIDGVETLELRFEEVTTPRMIGTPDDAPAVGRVWIAPTNGTVLRTELRVASSNVAAAIIVRYTWHERLSQWVPVEMAETYEAEGGETMGVVDVERGGGIRTGVRITVECRADYSDFRQFSVNTSEIIRKRP